MAEQTTPFPEDIQNRENNLGEAETSKGFESQAQSADKEVVQTNRILPVLHKFKGQPCLKDYVKGYRIEHKGYIQSAEICSRKLNRLELGKLPHRCFMYYKQQQLYQSSEVISQGDNLIFFDALQNRSKSALGCHETAIKLKVSALPKSTVLCAVQTLAFCVMNFEEFQCIFKTHLSRFKRNIFQFCSEKFCISQLCLNFQNNLRINSQKSEKMSQNLIQRQKEVKLIQQDDAEIDILSQIFFKKLCFSNTEYCLWPCLILQPFIGEKERLSNIIRLMDQHLVAQNSDEIIFEKITEQIQLRIFQTKNRGEPTPLFNQILTKIQRTRIQNSTHQTFCIKFIGCLKTSIVPRNRLVHYSAFSYPEVSSIMSNPRLCILIPLLNQFIKDLNTVKQSEYSKSVRGSSLGKICKYRPADHNLWMICIPLNFDLEAKDKKQVFVRSLSDAKYYWVDEQYLMINNTIPAYTTLDQFKKIATELHHKDIPKFIYTDMYDVQEDFRVAINKSEEECHSEDTIEKCAECHQNIRLYLGSAKCRVCLSLKVMQQRGLEAQFFKKFNQIYSKRCHICATIAKDYNLRCVKCSRRFHLFCCSPQYPNEQLLRHSFVCLECLKCDYCSKTICIQSHYPYSVTDKTLICFECRLISKTPPQICLFCQEPLLSKQSSVSCQIQSCSNKIHKTCDPIYKKLPTSSNKRKYYCPPCRILMRRKVLKWILDDLRLFDQYQYYYQPCYQDILDYDEVIKEPMCVLIMKDKIMNGEYDDCPFDKIKSDFQLIITNALTYNSPRDDPFYRAKIFYIVGVQFLQHCRGLISISDQELMSFDVCNVFKAKLRQFYQRLSRNYVSMILNYQQEQSQIEISINDKRPKGDFCFNSRQLLMEQLGNNSPLKFKLKLAPESVDSLFKCLKSARGLISISSIKFCSYHPTDNLPILHQCELCWQYYCCTSHCPKHNICSICPARSCICEIDPLCKCRTKSSEQIQTKVIEYASKHNLTIEEITEYNKYCLKCAFQNIHSHICYICLRFCCYGYEKCNKCGYFYHFGCLSKKLKDSFAGEISNQDLNLDISSLMRRCCSICLHKQQKSAELISKFVENIKSSSKHALKCRKFLNIISYLYKTQGIVFPSEKLLYTLLYSCKEKLIESQTFLDEMVRERSVVEEIIKDQNKEKKEEYEKKMQHMGVLNLKENYLEGLIDQEELEVHRERLRKIIQQYFKNEPLKEKLEEEEEEEKTIMWPQIDTSNNMSLLIQTQQIHRRIEQSTTQIPNPAPQAIKQPATAPSLKDRNPLQTMKWRIKINYIKRLLLSLYNQNQLVLKYGNISVLECSDNHWKCMKYFRSYPYIFQIIRNKYQWYFVINQNTYPVENLHDILSKISKINPHITKRQTLIEFLGMNIEVAVHQKTHFSDLLRTPCMADISRKERKLLTQQSFNSMQTRLEQGTIVKLKGQQLKANIFYLKKRTKPDRFRLNNNHLNIKISLFEIKRQLNLIPKKEAETDIKEIFLKRAEEDILYVGPSRIDRLGIFTKKNIAKNTIVIQYKGELISEKIADLREKNYHFGCYMFAMADSKERVSVVDATFIGNMARFLNHSCNVTIGLSQPNCEAKIIKKSKESTILIYTIKKIERYEELTYDYQFKKENKQILECKCKSPNCQQRLN